MCPLAVSLFLTNVNSMLLWWTLNSVLVINTKVVKETLQWRSVWRAQMQSYVIQTELISELNLHCTQFTLVERHFRSKND